MKTTQGGAAPTPRTGFVEIIFCENEDINGPFHELADHARTLERETQAQAKRIEELEGALKLALGWFEREADSLNIEADPEPLTEFSSNNNTIDVAALRKALLNRTP